MGKHLQKLFSFRTDEEIIEKINIIAQENSRTRNKQIEHILKEFIKDYENKNGKIEIKQINIENISHSGSGNINIK